MLIIIIVGALNINGMCSDPGIKPPSSCSWNQNGAIGFKSLSLTFPVSGTSINLDNDLYYFKQQLMVNHWNITGYKGNEVVSLQDIFDYKKVYTDISRVSNCQFDIATTAEGCSSETLSKSKTYSTLIASDIVYHSSSGYLCANELLNQYYGYSSDYTVTQDKNTMKITVTFGPIKDNVSLKMGNIVWTTSAKIGPENTFNQTGTFKAIEVSVKSIYVGSKFINELL